MSLIAAGLVFKKIGWFIWDYKLYFLAGLALLLLLLQFRDCGSSPPQKLDEKKIQEAILAVEQKNYGPLKELLIEAEVKEQQIDANVAGAKLETIKATEAAKEKYRDMSLEQLAQELERRR